MDRDWTKDDEDSPPIHESDRPGVDPSSYTAEGAKARSKHCHYCGGQGMVTLYHRDYAGMPTVEYIAADGEVRSEAARVMGYCKCDYGVWISMNHQKTAKDVFNRTPDIRDVLEGNSYWFLNDVTLSPPTEAEAAKLPKRFRELLAKKMRPH